jgi:hypothetical protein
MVAAASTVQAIRSSSEFNTINSHSINSPRVTNTIWIWKQSTLYIKVKKYLLTLSIVKE